MSVEIIRALFDAWSRREVDVVLASVDEEMEWHPALAAGGLEGTVYRGHSGIRRWFGELGEVWSELSLEVEEIRERGGGQVPS